MIYLVKQRLNPWPYLFIAPYFIIYLIFGFYPILYSLGISFTNWDGIGSIHFVGFTNYIKLFTIDPYFWKSIINTLILLLESLPVQIIGGLLLAVALFSKRAKFKRLFQLVNFLPYITTPVAVGLIFWMFFDWQTGIVNRILTQSGILAEGINWLGNVWPARIVVGLMIIWKYTGYTMVIYLAGLANIPNDIYEAAYVDGSGPVHTFFKITVPLLRPVTVFLVITSIIGGLQLFDEPKLLLAGWGGASGSVVGGPDRGCLTAVWNLYDTAFGSNMRYGMGAAIAYGLFLVIFLVSIIGAKFLNRGGDET